MEVKKILCAVDLEDTIAPSVEYAKMMALPMSSRLTRRMRMCIFPSTTSRMK